MPQSPSAKRPGRKRTPPKKAKNPQLKNNFFNTPEGRLAQAKGGRKGGRNGSRLGVPDGFGKANRDKLEAAREKGRVEAPKLIQIMKDKGMINEPETKEDRLAEEALEFAIGVVRAEVDGTRDRLAAARTVLDFTKQKPASNANVNVQRAEDFLEALADDA
ncbi:hypothetical protein [Pyruvatibacter sp.]